MSRIKDLVIEAIDMYEQCKPASYIMDVLIDQHGMSYDQALDVYEQAIKCSKYGDVSGVL